MSYIKIEKNAFDKSTLKADVMLKDMKGELWRYAPNPKLKVTDVNYCAGQIYFDFEFMAENPDVSPIGPNEIRHSHIPFVKGSVCFELPMDSALAIIKDQLKKFNKVKTVLEAVKE